MGFRGPEAGPREGGFIPAGWRRTLSGPDAWVLGGTVCSSPFFSLDECCQLHDEWGLVAGMASCKTLGFFWFLFPLSYVSECYSPSEYWRYVSL